MKKLIRIALAEDHDLFREGLVSLLNGEKGINLLLEVSNGEELLEGLKTHEVDVVLLDLNMPVLNGKETLKLLRQNFPDVRPIVISMFHFENYISETIKMGARGFLPKNCSIETVVDSIFAVYEQGYYFHDEISRNLLQDVIYQMQIEPSIETESITELDRGILELICDEKKNNEIAEILNISVSNVESHRKKLMDMAKAKNVAGLVIYAIKEGYFNIFPDINR